MAGTKKLTVPQTSSSFQWNAPEVVSLCSQRSLYIMAKRLPLMWPGENVGYYSYFFLLWLHPETNCIVFLSMAILGKRVSVMFLSYLTQNPKINRKEGSKHSLVLSSIPGMSISNTMVSYHVSPFLNFRMTHTSLPYTTVCLICHLSWKFQIPQVHGTLPVPQAQQALRALQVLWAR